MRTSANKLNQLVFVRCRSFLAACGVTDQRSLVRQAANGGFVPFSILASLLLLLLQPGCASPEIPVTLIPGNSGKHLQVAFNRAYYAPTQSGEDRIVVVDDPIEDRLNASAGQPLPPVQSPPIWHVLLIDLHFRNAPSGNPDSPIADNASLHWYVFGKPTDTTTGVLHYSGPSAVWLSITSTGANIRIRSEELELLDQHGPLHDPFHNFRINTTFKATTDSTRVQATLDEVNKAIQDADRSGEKARRPSTRPASP